MGLWEEGQEGRVKRGERFGKLSHSFAKALYLCDGHIGFANQKTDLMGIFNSIRPKQYPHRQKQFVVFAQLIAGLGQVPFHVEVRFAQTGLVVHSSGTHVLTFPRRDKIVQLVYDARLFLPTCRRLFGRIVLQWTMGGGYRFKSFCNGAYQ
jgi:hypothetical protein